jgi:hypothetical protein
MSRPTTSASTSCSVALLVPALLGALVLAAGRADAQAALYHSAGNDGVPPTTTPVLPSPGPEWLHLYADTAGSNPTTSGTACEDGDGNEICGWHVTVQAGPNAELLSFTPAPGVYYNLSTSQVVDELTATAVSVVSPPSVAPVWVGDLLVQSTDPTLPSQVDVTGVHVVTADLSAQPVAVATLAILPVPEPGQLAGLLAGCSLLFCLRPRAR